MFRSLHDYAKSKGDSLADLRALARWLYNRSHWSSASGDFKRLNDLVKKVTDELREGRDLANLLDGSAEGASIEDMKESVEYVFDDLGVGDLAELVQLARSGGRDTETTREAIRSLRSVFFAHTSLGNMVKSVRELVDEVPHSRTVASAKQNVRYLKSGLESLAVEVGMEDGVLDDRAPWDVVNEICSRIDDLRESGGCEESDEHLERLGGLFRSLKDPDDILQYLEDTVSTFDSDHLSGVLAEAKRGRRILDRVTSLLDEEYDLETWQDRDRLVARITHLVESSEKPNESVAHDRAILMDKFANIFDDLSSGGAEMIVEIFKAEGIDTDVEEVRQYIGE